MRHPYAIFIIFFAFLFTTLAYAQQRDSLLIEEEEEETPVDYTKLVATETVKAFCSARVIGLSPQKLISIGYDFQLPYTLNAAFDPYTATPPANNATKLPADVAFNRGLRVNVNYPVISRNNILLSIGANYSEHLFQLSRPTDAAGTQGVNSDFLNTLSQDGLRSVSLNATLFKPLDLKHFLLFQVSGALNGDYFQGLEHTRWGASAIFGWKPNDRLMWGIGVSRSYLAGALNYFPVVFYNHTFNNTKWGIEAVLPARLNLRHKLNDKNILFFGYELEGNTYRLSRMSSNATAITGRTANYELRRAELRVRLTYERAITKLLWFSIQGGYRANWVFNVDDGDFFRSIFSNQQFLMENQLGNPLYFQISINYVSP